MLKKFFLLLALFLAIPLFNLVFADDQYKVDYHVEYFLNQSTTAENNVKFHITVTNLNNEVYVKHFMIFFPTTFSIGNITASDDSGPITPKVETVDQDLKIDLAFSDPKTGRDSVNNFYLDFHQNNLFKNSGSSWELILPTIENKSNVNYQVIVNLPPIMDKKLSISKPKPDTLTDTQAIWNNPSTKTIYAVFGDTQYYHLDLTYHLKNPRLIPINTELALPPDTSYQKIYVNKLSPQPTSVYRDNDGNYLARYTLGSNEIKTVQFSGDVLITANPRQETLTGNVQNSDSSDLSINNKYWSLGQNVFKNLNTISEIYNFTTNMLHYNYSRSFDSASRLGAVNALLHPNNAVCVEYSDVFVALARSKGIPAREIEGYGNSSDTRLRPLSLISDVLHSWPEYFDKQKSYWVPVDPTWENTSGIDYFSSLDYNHIAFAIHGKQPDYPLPAGMYKVENSKDVVVKPLTDIPKENTDLEISSFVFPSQIYSNRVYKVNLSLINKGNTFIYSVPVQFNSKSLNINQSTNIVKVLAPYEKIEIPISFKSSAVQGKKNDQLIVQVKGKDIYKESFTIVPFYLAFALKSSFILGFILLIIMSLFILRRYFLKSHAK